MDNSLNVFLVDQFSLHLMLHTAVTSRYLIETDVQRLADHWAHFTTKECL